MNTAQHRASVIDARTRGFGMTPLPFSENSPLLSEVMEFLSETAGGCVIARFPSLARLVLLVDEVSESRAPGTNGGPVGALGSLYAWGSIEAREDDETMVTRARGARETRKRKTPTMEW
jgi:hypothetical protein